MPDPDASHDPWDFICPRCRYDTRTLTTSRCPECGIARDDAVALVTRRKRAGELRWRIAAASFTTLTGTACAFVALAIVTGAYRHGFRDNTERMWAISLLATCAAGISIAAVNWIRVARPRRPLHFGWTLILVLTLLYQLAIVP